MRRGLPCHLREVMGWPVRPCSRDSAGAVRHRVVLGKILGLRSVWAAVRVAWVVVPPIQIITKNGPHSWERNKRFGRQKETTGDGLGNEIQDAVAH